MFSKIGFNSISTNKFFYNYKITLLKSVLYKIETVLKCIFTKHSIYQNSISCPTYFSKKAFIKYNSSLRLII